MEIFFSVLQQKLYVLSFFVTGCRLTTKENPKILIKCKKQSTKAMLWDRSFMENQFIRLKR